MKKSVFETLFLCLFGLCFLAGCGDDSSNASAPSVSGDAGDTGNGTLPMYSSEGGAVPGGSSAGSAVPGGSSANSGNADELSSMATECYESQSKDVQKENYYGNGGLYNVHYVCFNGKFIIFSVEKIGDLPQSSSSETVVESSESSAEPFQGACSTDLWCGKNGLSAVNTGLGAGNKGVGEWYSFTDESVGGTSRIEWPVAVSETSGFGAVVKNCNGLCGTAVFSRPDTDESPYVALAFNVAGESAGVPQPADVWHEWFGLCVQYSSDYPIRVELGMGPEKDEALDYDLPWWNLPASKDVVTECKQWNSFNEGNRSGMTGDEASSKLVSVKFFIYGEDGKTGSFNIIGVGTKK